MAGAAMGGMAVVGSLMDLGGRILSAPDTWRPPAYEKIDPSQIQAQTVSGNQAVLPEAEKLASATNTYNAAELQKMWQNILPQYNAMLSTASGNIMDQLQGNIPLDVSQAVQRSSASHALAGGFGEGGMKENLVARDLGLTSLDISNRALSSMQSFLATLKSTSLPTPMSPATMMFTPEQRYTMQAQENMRAYQSELLRTKIATLPNPTNAAIGGWLSDTGQMMEGAGMMGLAGGMGGGGSPRASGDMGGGPMGEGNWWSGS